MAIRRRAARPDDVIEVQDPATGELVGLPIISRDQMRELMLDGEALLAMAGGVFTVYVQRARTGVPNEMVTVAAVGEWKDRADARPQPEDGGQQIARQEPAAPAPAIQGDPELAQVAAEAAAQLQGQDQPAAPAPRTTAADDDDEDLSSIPPHLQEVVG